MRRLLPYVPLAAAILVAFVAGLVPLPYYSLGPGPAREIAPLITVDGRPVYESRGRFIMTTVEFRQVTATGALLAWLDADLAVLPRDALFPEGETEQQEERRSVSEMDQSKIDATYVVLTELGEYPREHGIGSLVRATVPGCSADGVLYPGDLVREINGRPIRNVGAAERAIESVPSGQALRFDVRPLGETRSESVRLVRRPCGGSNKPLVGVSMIDNFPFEVAIESGDVGGPSAGLMWAVGLYDRLTPGDLTHGRTIAGTGTISLDGAVGPIGGIEEKVLGADDAGASALIVPSDNAMDARAVRPPDLRLLPVASFDEAVSVLASPAARRSPDTTPSPVTTPS
jgi:PDZ domain-containing protein